MGADRSVSIKNTFIHVDIHAIEDASVFHKRSERRIQSWPSTSVSYELDAFLQDEMAQSEALMEDSASERCCRFKTEDDFEYCEYGVARESPEISNQPLPCLMGIGGNRYRPGHAQRRVTFSTDVAEEDAQLEAKSDRVVPVVPPQACVPTTPCQHQSAPLEPVYMMPVSAPMAISSPPIMWPYSPVLGPASALEFPRLTPISFEETSTAHQYTGTNEHVQADDRDDKSTWTCQMIINIPNDYTRQDLLSLLDCKQLQYTFVYLPFDWRKRANLGYAFVNFISHTEAQRVATILSGFSDWTLQSRKVCEVVWAKANQQNLEENIERFRNSSIMHSDVPERFKPLIFLNGKRVEFPAPTKPLTLPQGFKSTR